MKRIRFFTTIGAALFLLCAGSVPTAFAQAVPGGTLDPLSIPKYVTPLVIPPVMNDAAADTDPTTNDYDIAVRQFQQQILPGGIWNTVNGRADAFPPTTVWSYGPAADPLPDSTALGGGMGIAPAANSQFNYPAYTVENTQDMPTSVNWINDLKENFGAGPNFLPHLLPIDQTLHWANPGADCIDGIPRTDCRGQSQVPYTGPVPIIVHVHGAHVAPESDGYPEAWYLPDPTNADGTNAGFNCVTDPTLADNVANFVCEGTVVNKYNPIPNTNVTPGEANFSYNNDQPTATFWYHDHSLGMTRNNVYAGPAGFWLLREADGGETGSDPGNILPGPAPVAGEGLATTNLTLAQTQALGLGDIGEREKYREIPIVVQDRSFNADGSLFYPDNRAFFEGLQPKDLKIPFIGDPKDPSDISPIWNPEAFFNTMVVNGTTWPVLNVAQAEYRLRMLNGCNSRFLNLAMFVVDPVTNQIDPAQEIPFYQIGAEQSVLPAVVQITTGFKTVLPGNGTIPAATPTATPEEALLMGLAERADTIVDFKGLVDGTRVRMINTAPDAPFGGFPDIPADPGTSGQVMEFVVDSALNGTSPTDPGGATPATAPQDLVLSLPDQAQDNLPSTATRDLALLEEESALVCVTVKPNGKVKYDKKATPDLAFPGTCIDKKGRLAKSIPFAPKAAVLGTNGAGGGKVQLWSDPVQTNPGFMDTETWELWNWTVDGHPIHLHLVKFKVVNREAIDPMTGLGDGLVIDPSPTEAGWKDTVIALPGEITRVKSTFDIAGLYVWHCHIVEHEDNEMMVPYCVGDPTANGCQNLAFAPPVP